MGNDMMTFLSSTDPSFEQVIAVDADFKLFSRAWCVAEIAAANIAGMKHNLKINAASTLEDYADDLRALRIENMEASRPEDRDEILAGIPDTNASNVRLQSLLFNELFPAWEELDASEQMNRVGAMARWHNAGRHVAQLRA